MAAIHIPQDYVYTHTSAIKIYFLVVKTFQDFFEKFIINYEILISSVMYVFTNMYMYSQE